MNDQKKDTSESDLLEILQNLIKEKRVYPAKLLEVYQKKY